MRDDDVSLKIYRDPDTYIYIYRYIYFITVLTVRCISRQAYEEWIHHNLKDNPHPLYLYVQMKHGRQITSAMPPLNLTDRRTLNTLLTNYCYIIIRLAVMLCTTRADASPASTCRCFTRFDVPLPRHLVLMICIYVLRCQFM